MSEKINNREYRKNVIKQVISQLHAGKTVEEVKQQFEEAFAGVSASEISEAEQALIADGLPITEVQRLCDVHAAVFKGSIEEIHQPVDPVKMPGHPANILKRENRAIEKLIDDEIIPHLDSLPDDVNISSLRDGLERLARIHIHYLKKENLFFPYMERYGITAPPKVMWGVDDEIRAQLKDVRAQLSGSPEGRQDLLQNLKNLTDKIIEMIFKEENIMLPMLLETLTLDEWKRIADDSAEIGYMIHDVPGFQPASAQTAVIPQEDSQPGIVTLPTGVLKVDEIIGMLNALPFDITFVDKNDTVKYFSQGAERIFPRTKAIIGREVVNCHPPASAHIVEQIVEDLKTGKKEHEDFWIHSGDKLILIRYYAVRDENGEYLGVVEVTQNIKPIQDITGEKRLVSE